MKGRVPGRQFAAAARETPSPSKSGKGRNYSAYFTVMHDDHLLYILVTHCFAFIISIYSESNQRKEEIIRGQKRGIERSVVLSVQSWRKECG